MNFDDVRTFFLNKLKNANISGVSSENISSENVLFEIGQKPLFVDFRVAPTKTTTFTDKKKLIEGTAIYCVCVRPNVGTTTLESVAASIVDLFDPQVGTKAIFSNVATGWRLFVRSVESLPSYLIDKHHKKNVRITFDLIES